MKDIDWTNVWEVERDICYLYHELSEVQGIDGDLAYGTIYAQPYWQFLDLSAFQMPEAERRFITEGCLIFILAMAWDVIDGSGSYISDKLVRCQQAIDKLIATDDNERKLVLTVKLALSAAATGAGTSDQLEALSDWVNRTYICGYFERKIVESPYLRRGGRENGA